MTQTTPDVYTIIDTQRLKIEWLQAENEKLRRQVDSLTTTFCYAPDVETWPRYEELKQVMADRADKKFIDAMLGE
jgi:hypothetical protein